MGGTVRLGLMTSPSLVTAVTKRTVALLPVGAFEQHAAHLPVAMDANAAFTVAEKVETLRPASTLLLPLLPFGASDHHSGFAGTVSIGTELLARTLAEVVASLRQTSGVQRFLIVNGHGGNLPAIRWALDLAQRAGSDVEVRALSYWDALFDALDEQERPRHGPMGHADRYETSIALALDPEGVDLQRMSVDGFTDGLPSWVQTSRGFRERTRGGGVGDPVGASAEEGAEYLALACDRIAGLLDQW